MTLVLTLTTSLPSQTPSSTLTVLIVRKVTGEVMAGVPGLARAAS